MLVTDLTSKSSPSMSDYLLGCPESTEYYKILVSDMAKAIVETYAASSLAGSSQSVQNALATLYANVGSGAGYHNCIFRGKKLGSSTSDVANYNSVIKNRTYTDMFIGDYFVINGHTWRIAAFEYYYNVGSTAYTRGHVTLVPDYNLYSAQMAWTDTGAYVSGSTANTTAGAYALSHMRNDNMNAGVEGSSYGSAGLAQARSTALTDFGNRLASHKIYLANAVSNGKASGWAEYTSDGVELMSETQVYGHRAWGSGDQNGYEVGTQKTQFPLFLLSPSYIANRSIYWLQGVVSAVCFAFVGGNGDANNGNASVAYGVRPAVTITYTE